MEEQMKQVSQETLKDNEFNSKAFYKKHPELNIVALTGSTKRKLIRQNTVHLRGVCPACGEFGTRYSKSEKKWICKKCGTKAGRRELEYVKYN